MSNSHQPQRATAMLKQETACDDSLKPLNKDLKEDNDESNRTAIAAPAEVASMAPEAARIIQIYGEGIGTFYTITGEITIGRDFSSTVSLKGNNVSRRHARIFLVDDNCYIEDLGSTNGTFVSDTGIIGKTPLRNGDLIKVGGFIFKYIAGGNIESLYHEEIYRMTITDGLTLVYNRRYFDECLEREVLRSRHYKRPLCLVMVEVADMEDIGDIFGTIARDHVLKNVAELIQNLLRQEDLLARYSGNRFAIILPERKTEDASDIVEQVKSLIRNRMFTFDDEEIGLRISAGISSIEVCDTPERLVETAETKLRDSGSSRSDYFSAFISYSHGDRFFARWLFSKLRSQGVRCWLDEYQMLPGDDIHDQVTSAIHLSHKVLLCCSKESLNSWWVDNEIGQALEKERALMQESGGKKSQVIIPLNLDDYIFSEDPSSTRIREIRGRLAADFTGWDSQEAKLDSQIEKIVTVLRTADKEYHRALVAKNANLIRNEDVTQDGAAVKVQPADSGIEISE